MLTRIVILTLCLINSITIMHGDDTPKRALITGVSRGIGFALAQNLLKRGIHVLGISRSENSEIKTLSTHPHCTYLPMDITKNESLSTLKKFIDSHHYTFDFVINNAAIMMEPKNIDTIDIDTIEQVIQANLIAPMKLSQSIIPYCNSNTKILNVTSRAATTAVPQLAPYCVSKAGLNMFSSILKKELQDRKIAVASVIPGEVDTEIQGILRNAPDFRLQQQFNENYDGKNLLVLKCARSFYHGFCVKLRLMNLIIKNNRGIFTIPLIIANGYKELCQNLLFKSYSTKNN